MKILFALLPKYFATVSTGKFEAELNGNASSVIRPDGKKAGSGFTEREAMQFAQTLNKFARREQGFDLNRSPAVSGCQPQH